MSKNKSSNSCSQTKNLPKVVQTFFNLGLLSLGKAHRDFQPLQTKIRKLNTISDIKSILEEFVEFHSIMIDLVDSQQHLIQSILQAKSRYNNMIIIMKYFNKICNFIIDPTLL